MLLKNHLIEVFKKASLENNFLLKENIILKWVHRFGIDSLNDLFIHSPVAVKRENQNKEENQEDIRLELLKTSEAPEEIKCESIELETSRSNEIIRKNQDSNKVKIDIDTTISPLPYLKNLRKWINTDKKAS